MASSGRRLPLLPRPRPAAAELDADRVDRRLDCASYDDCLELADGWRGFHCRACGAYQRATPAARELDAPKLCALAARVLIAAPANAANENN